MATFARVRQQRPIPAQRLQRRSPLVFFLPVLFYSRQTGTSQPLSLSLSHIPQRRKSSALYIISPFFLVEDHRVTHTGSRPLKGVIFPATYSLNSRHSSTYAFSFRKHISLTRQDGIAFDMIQVSQAAKKRKPRLNSSTNCR
jgi:hypothetical protein